jgi:hypothetical protein
VRNYGASIWIKLDRRRNLQVDAESTIIPIQYGTKRGIGVRSGKVDALLPARPLSWRAQVQHLGRRLLPWVA